MIPGVKQTSVFCGHAYFKQSNRSSQFVAPVGFLLGIKMIEQIYSTQWRKGLGGKTPFPTQPQNIHAIKIRLIARLM